MLKLIKKELTLNVPAPLYLLSLLAAMILIPNYPYIVGIGYTIMQVMLYMQTVQVNLSQEFSAMLPVKRSDVVTSSTLVIVLFQTLTVLLTICLLPLAKTLYPNGNIVGMDANFTFVGVALICLATFNATFIPNYFKTGYKYGMPLLWGLIAFVLTYAVCEVFVQVFAHLFEGYSLQTIAVRLVVLFVGIAIYTLTTLFANKRAIEKFKRVNL